MTSVTNNQTSEQQLEQALVDRAINKVASVSVDGMSTAYANIDPAQALSVLQKQKASRTPLSAIKFFRIKSNN